nr:hypothetical protein [bacterium]
MLEYYLFSVPRTNGKNQFVGRGYRCPRQQKRPDGRSCRQRSDRRGVAAKDEEIASLKAAKETAEAEIARLRKEKEDAVAVEAVSFADALVKAGKIAADAKDAVIETFKANPENARKIFGSVPERTKLSSLAGTQGGDAGKYAAKSWDELDRAGLLAELKANHPDLYEKKYKEMAASLHICRG